MYTESVTTAPGATQPEELGSADWWHHEVGRYVARLMALSAARRIDNIAEIPRPPDMPTAKDRRRASREWDELERWAKDALGILPEPQDPPYGTLRKRETADATLEARLLAGMVITGAEMARQALGDAEE